MGSIAQVKDGQILESISSLNKETKTFYQTDDVKPNSEYENLYQRFIELITA